MPAGESWEWERVWAEGFLEEGPPLAQRLFTPREGGQGAKWTFLEF